jgi:3-hydroxyacyl-CoA dehydrogenase/3a,7a,12a-trihydroxy-5b-cholest-24-enoyl-CoA hydratase/multifunctional beta-oxidation protein/peroxisomal enoyl-CoA hydratase 2
MSIDPTKTLGFETEEVKALCTDRDAILYSLGIGYSQDPMNAEELAYTYELHDDFKVFPTYTTCLHRSDLFKV